MSITVVFARAGAKLAVRVVPPGRVDHDRAFANYREAKAYADDLTGRLGARLHNICDGETA